MLGKSSTFWNVRAMPSLITRLDGVCISEWPSKSTSPESTRYRRVITLKAVVLPAPFGPIRPAIVPSATSSDTSSSATMPPKRREACSRERRPIRTGRNPTESTGEGEGLRSGAVSRGGVLLPEVLHGGGAGRGDVRRVVGRVVHGADHPGAVGRDVEDVDAGGRLLE